MPNDLSHVNKKNMQVHLIWFIRSFSFQLVNFNVLGIYGNRLEKALRVPNS